MIPSCRQKENLPDKILHLFSHAISALKGLKHLSFSCLL